MRTLTILNKEGSAIFERRAKNELHIVCIYVDFMLSKGIAIGGDKQPFSVVDDDTLSIMQVNFDKMVQGLFF